MTERTPEASAVIEVEPFPPPPVCWATLDPEQAAAALATLQTWVTWLVGRYGLDHRTVPACWPEHGELVEELSALHGAWRVAYAVTTTATAPLDWHTNFAAARGRLTDWIALSGCRPGQHRSRLPFTE